jgi:hypothetical protein
MGESTGISKDFIMSGLVGVIVRVQTHSRSKSKSSQMYHMSGTFTHIVSLGISLKRGLRRSIEEFKGNTNL